MKVYELLFLLSGHLAKSKTKKPSASPFLSRAYGDVILKIRESHDMNNNITKKDVASLDITDHMKDKLCKLLKEKINTKDSDALKKSHLRDQLINVAGIGKKKADELLDLGIKDIKSLKQEKWKAHLNSGTLILLKHKPITKIPHEQIKKIEPKLTLFDKARATLVGGFLRKKPFSKDIDVMIISDSPDVLIDYMEHLREHFNKVVVYSQGHDKVSLIIQPNKKKNYFKMDVFRSPKKYQYAMLLYGTGSKQFNIKMRATARRHGFLLNQHGLFTLPIKKSQEPISVSSEKDIFRKINIPYVLPQNR
jgi:DNA polymerase/3'-5' exonuclease PolX